MKLSVVATLYRSELYIQEFVRRVCAAALSITADFELILVHDGSPDRSLEAAVALSRANPRIVVVDLSRNFGHHKAMMTGLEQARGEFVFLIDSDLEEPPELLETFFGELQSRNCDVVYGYLAKRSRGLLDRLVGEGFYRLFNHISDIKIPTNLATARLMTRRYVRALLRHRERAIFIDGLWAATGFEQVGMAVDKRFKGATSYSVWKRIALALNSITSFSDRPLALVAILGAAISTLSALVCLYLAILYLTHHLLSGWLSLIASIWLLGGLTIFCIGLIGLYVSRIFLEVKQRPYAIVRDLYRNGVPIPENDEML